MKTLYTATIQVKGGRDGAVRSDDGHLEAQLAFPRALGGSGEGTNPEQLFAAAYAACFASTVQTIAKADNLPIGDLAIRGEVDILLEGTTYDLAVRLFLTAHGVDRAGLADVVEKAKATCPYARAIRNNVRTEVTLGP